MKMAKSPTRRSIILGTFAIIFCLGDLQGQVEAWGGLFNRFTPEMLSNLGYGGHGAGYRHSYLQVYAFIDWFEGT